MTLFEDLRQTLRERPASAVFVVGTGVPLGALRDTPCREVASWDGLLRSGLQRAHDLGRLTPEELATYKTQLGHTRAGALLGVATVVEQELGAPNGGEFRRWLRETVGAFDQNLRHPGVLAALAEHQRNGALLATTNYDLLLEHATGLKPVTWRDPAGVERALRGDEPQILHLHGVWKSSESVVLGIKSYEDVVRDGHAQTVLTTLRTDRTFIFVGCGAGLRDPNLGTFLKWTARVFAGSEYRHFRLCLQSEVGELRREHPDEQRIFPLAYGTDHGDLAPYLRSLLPAGRTGPSSSGATVPASSPSSGAVLSSPPSSSAVQTPPGALTPPSPGPSEDAAPNSPPLVASTSILQGTSPTGQNPSPPSPHAPPITPAASSNVDGAPLHPTGLVLIFTTKEDEFLAVYNRLPQPEEKQVMSGARYYKSVVATPRGALAIAILRIFHGGGSSTRGVVQRALSDLHPNWVVVCGIADGVPNKEITIGDVVISSEIINVSDDHTLLASVKPFHPAVYGVVANLPATILSFRQWAEPDHTGSQRPSPPSESQLVPDLPPAYRAKLAESIQHHERTARANPRHVIGEVASSDRQMKDPAAVESLLKSERQIRCIDRESVDVQAACTEEVPLLVIRGISAIAGIHPLNEWLVYACNTAASMTIQIAKSGCLLPIPLEAGLQEPRMAPSHDVQVANASPSHLRAIRTVDDESTLRPGLVPDSLSAEVLGLALQNIQHFGDTDIFPRPFELGAFRDQRQRAIQMLRDLDAGFDDLFPKQPPEHISTLSQAGHSGFRWATQMDPLYNALLLSYVLRIAPQVEQARLVTQTAGVFSYRYAPDLVSGKLFDEDSTWQGFLDNAYHAADQHSHVVRTDIADFYHRVMHRKLFVALAAVSRDKNAVSRIESLLIQYSNDSGVGLPVGGPAARILSELYLNQSDHVLYSQGIKFCRYSDDYVIFARSEAQAMQVLTELARTLLEHDGLSLQKLKTRIMRSSEFVRSYLAEPQSDLDHRSMSFLRLRLRYDPYSSTASDDYKSVRKHLSDYDIMGMLAREMRKSRVHQQLTKKLLFAARFIGDADVDSAALNITANLENLSAVFTPAIALLSALLPRLDEGTRAKMAEELETFLGGRRLVLDLQRMALIRLLASVGDANGRVKDILWRQYQERENVMVRKECIWGLLRLGATNRLQPLLERFDLSPTWERRALLAASFICGTSGASFRSRVKSRLTLMETLVLEWCESREVGLFGGDMP